MDHVGGPRAYGRDIGTSLPEMLWHVVDLLPEGTMMRLGITPLHSGAPCRDRQNPEASTGMSSSIFQSSQALIRFFPTCAASILWLTSIAGGSPAAARPGHDDYDGHHLWVSCRKRRRFCGDSSAGGKVPLPSPVHFAVLSAARDASSQHEASKGRLKSRGLVQSLRFSNLRGRVEKRRN